MADRSVVIRLRAEVDQAQRALRGVADSVKGISTTAATAARGTTGALGSIADSARKNEQAWQTVGAGIAGIGAAAAVGVGAAVKRFADFDAAMSNVRAATGETAANMEKLRAAAIDAGAETAFSAIEAADAIEQLAKAGVSTTDILAGGLQGALDLAAAGQLDVGAAAEFAASTMTQFNLKGGDVVHVADLLAAAAGKAQGEVQDVGLAMSYAGVPAANLGVSIEETAGAIALFASNGIIGEKAGTALRGMLVSMTNPVGKTKELMDELRISFFDAQGEFIGLEGVADVLQDRLGGLTDQQRNAALAQIFGNESLAAAQSLYREGATGVEEWTNKVNDQGYAAEQAAMRLDNLKGDLEALGGSIETALIGVGSGANGPLRALVQGATDAINAFAGLPTPIQQGTLALGGLTAGIGLVGGGLLLAVPKVVQFYDALGNLGTFGEKAQGGMQKMGDALPTAAKWAAAATAVLAVAQASEKLVHALGPAAPAVEEATSALLGMQAAGDLEGLFADNAGGVDTFTGALDRLQQKNPAQAFGDIALSLIGLEGRHIRQAADDIGAIDQALAGLVGSGHGDRAAEIHAALSREAEAVGIDVKYLNQELPLYQAALAGVENESRLAAEGEQQMATGLDAVTTAAGGALGVIPLIGDTANMTEEQVKEATDALQDWHDELAGIAAGFAEPLAIYQGMLADKEEAERKSAEATAAATESGEDSWEDYVKGTSVSLSEYAAKLEEQIAAQEEWRDNIIAVTQRGGLEVGQILTAMGAEGVDIVAAMATASDQEFTRMAEALIADARFGGQGAVAEFDKHMKIMAEVAAAGGETTAAAIAEKLGLGVQDVADIAAAYGVELAAGINPILSALGRQEIAVRRAARGARSGRTYTGYAEGGFEDHRAQIAPAGAWRVWAEPETGGEAYIPLSPAKRSRSLNIWEETGKRLGAFADGGFSDPDDVPGLPSLNPYRSPIRPPGDAANDKQRDAVIDFVRQHMEPQISPNGTGGLGPAAARAAAAVRDIFGFSGTIGGYANRNIAGTNKLSKHALGKAIDVMVYGNKSLGDNISRYFLANRGRFGVDNIIWYRRITNAGRGWQWGSYGGAHPHYDHPHIDFHADGGVRLPKGSPLNPHVRDEGGPLLPGFTYNGTGRPEVVLPMADGGYFGPTFSARTLDARAREVARGGGGTDDLRRVIDAFEKINEAKEYSVRLSELENDLLGAQADYRAAYAIRDHAAKNRAAEEGQRIRASMAELRADRTYRLQRESVDRLIASVEELERKREEAARAEEERQRELLENYRSRVDTLTGSLGGLGDVMQTSWGASAEWLTENIKAQNEAFREWQSTLSQVEGRGVFDRLIEEMGLDQGPAALGQLRQLAGASSADLRALNAAYAERLRLVDTQARRDTGYRLAYGGTGVPGGGSVQIRGTLDMGNGLEGRIQGVIDRNGQALLQAVRAGG